MGRKLQMTGVCITSEVAEKTGKNALTCCVPSQDLKLTRHHDVIVFSQERKTSISLMFQRDAIDLCQGAHSIFAGVFIQKMPTDLWCYQQAPCQIIHATRE